MRSRMSEFGPKAVGLLSGDRPEEAVDQRACVEWQGSTQTGPSPKFDLWPFLTPLQSFGAARRTTRADPMRASGISNAMRSRLSGFDPADRPDEALLPRVRCLRNDFAEELQPLGDQIRVDCREPRDIPARPVEAGGKTLAHRIGDGRHDDRDRIGGTLGRLGRGQGRRRDDIDLQINQLCRESREAVGPALCPTLLEDVRLSAARASAAGMRPRAAGGRPQGRRDRRVRSEKLCSSAARGRGVAKRRQCRRAPR